MTGPFCLDTVAIRQLITIPRLALVVLVLSSPPVGAELLNTVATGSAAPRPERPEVRQELPVTANDLRSARAQNSPLLAADPTNPRFVALANRLDAPEFNCALQLSGDGGRLWRSGRPVRELPEGAERCYAPEIAFDRDGTLYYLFIGLAGGGNSPTGVFLTKSEDRGRTFDKPRPLLGPQNYQVRMVLDPTMGDDGRLHLVWLKAGSDPPAGGLPPPPNPILASHSDDGGDSFSKPVQVSDPKRKLSVAPAVAVGPDHRVHVLYYDLQRDRVDYYGVAGPRWPGRWSLVSATSFNGGEDFERGIVVDERLAPPERVMLIFTMPPPALAAGKAGLFAAWHDARNGDWDAFLSRSGDKGRSWGKPKRLNDDRTGNGRHQYLPRLSLAPGGRLDAIFYDRRDDPRNLRNHVYYTYSSDGGRHLAPNIRLSAARSDSRYGQRYRVPSAEGKVEFGSRMALLSRDSSALAAWTDTRNSPAPLPQDIFAGEVSFPKDRATTPNPDSGEEGTSSHWPRNASFALGLLLCAAVARVLTRGVRSTGEAT